VASQDANTKLNLMMASGTYADVVMGGRSWGIGVDEYGPVQGIYLPLDDLIKEWMPNYDYLCADRFKNILKRADGKMYSLGIIAEDGIYLEIKHYMNFKWLDNLNLSVPTTVNELTDVFRAFKQNYPDGYPFNGLSTGGAWPLFNSVNMWGVSRWNGWTLNDDDTVEWTVFKPGYREAFEWLHMLYTDELVDPEFLTQDANMLSAKLDENNTGMIFAWSPKNRVNNEEFWEDMKLIMPVSADGYQAKMTRRESAPNHHTAVTITNKYVPETMRWLDAWLETDTIIRNYWGIEGKHWESENGKVKQLLDTPTLEDDAFGFSTGLYFIPAWFIDAHSVRSADTLMILEHTQKYIDAGLVEPVHINNVIGSYVPRTAEEIERMGILFTDINTLMLDSGTNFIINGVSDRSWQEFLDSLKAAGIDEYTALAQGVYNRFK